MADVGKFTIINDKELYALFKELIPSVQNKIINQGLKNAARLIIKEAKSNFKRVKKGKSKTNYQDFNSSFTVRNMKSKAGVIAGMSAREGYKYRFINYGTEPRSYKTKNGKAHLTGAISKTEFFTNAVEDKAKTAQQDVQEAITKAMNKTVEKYNRKYRL